MTWGTLSALKHYGRSRPNPPSDDKLPPLTVLKPVKGAEPGLAENIESFFLQDYPHFEILISIASDSDPARPILEEVVARHPHVAAKLFVGETRLGPNPKVNNLAQAYWRSSYPTLLISDSNVRVDAHYLRRLVPHLRPGVGLVTAVVAGFAPEGIGGYLEASYLNTFYARWMHIGAGFGFPMVVGKSMLFEKRTVERFGGLPTMARYVAEDYMTGQAIARLGLRVALANEPIRQNIGRHRLSDFWSRHIRWGRIRKAHAPLGFLFEPVMGPVLSSLIGGVALHSLWGLPLAAGVLIPFAVWFLLDLSLTARLGMRPDWRTVASWLVREILFFPLWCHIAIGNSVQWRGNRLRLLPGGILDDKIEAIKERRKEKWMVTNFSGARQRVVTKLMAIISIAIGGTGRRAVI